MTNSPTVNSPAPIVDGGARSVWFSSTANNCRRESGGRGKIDLPEDGLLQLCFGPATDRVPVEPCPEVHAGGPRGGCERCRTGPDAFGKPQAFYAGDDHYLLQYIFWGRVVEEVRGAWQGVMDLTRTCVAGSAARRGAVIGLNRR